MKTRGYILIWVALICVALIFFATSTSAQEGKMSASADWENLPVYLKDRGTGTATSMFGTYVRKGELLVYPFFEYYYDNNMEYSPSEFGFDLDEDFRGKYRASEGLVFIGYGLTDRLVIEIEVAVIKASLETSEDDSSSIAQTVTESGLGDVQTQLDLRWLKESEHRPELFSYAEVVYPHNKDKDLIGTSDWEIKVGTGIIRGFKWGTLTGRAAIEYTRAEEKVELGEMAVEYLKRISSKWRLYAGVEATQDEVELITEAQWHLSDRIFAKFNNAFGLTSKATDWAPEIGVMFSFPTR